MCLSSSGEHKVQVLSSLQFGCLDWTRHALIKNTVAQGVDGAIEHLSRYPVDRWHFMGCI